MVPTPLLLDIGTANTDETNDCLMGTFGKNNDCQAGAGYDNTCAAGSNLCC